MWSAFDWLQTGVGIIRRATATCDSPRPRSTGRIPLRPRESDNLLVRAWRDLYWGVAENVSGLCERACFERHCLLF